MADYMSKGAHALASISYQTWSGPWQSLPCPPFPFPFLFNGGPGVSSPENFLILQMLVDEF